MTVAERRPLGHLLLRPPRYGINAAAVPQSLGVPTYIRITDIDEFGRFAPDPKVGVAHAKASEYCMQAGELLFARTGASVGKSYLYDPGDGELVYAGFLINIAPDPARLNPKYLFLFAQSKEYWDWIARTSVRSGQPGVNGQEYAQLPVPVPAIQIQNAVAEVMTDVDHLIAALERVITKKLAIKQGMLQQLLTGRTRLPGFDRAWTTKSLAELGVTVRGVGYKPERDLSARRTSFTVDLLRANNVQDGTLNLNDVQHVDRRRVRADQYLREGDVLVCAANGSKRLVGKAAPVRGIREASLTFGAFMMVYRPNKALVVPSFAALQFQAKHYREWIEVLLAGSSINNIRPSDLAAFEVLLPDGDEQSAIASVLTDVDDEIELLHQRLAKARALRQGIMQQLLTGRTQLPAKAGAA